MKIKRPLVAFAVFAGAVSLAAVFVDTVLAVVLAAVAVFGTGVYAVIKNKEYLIFTALCICILASVTRGNVILGNAYAAAPTVQEICGEVVDVKAVPTGVDYTVKVGEGKLSGSKVCVRSKNSCLAVGDTADLTASLYVSDYSADRAEMIFMRGNIISINSTGQSKIGGFLEKIRNKITEKVFSGMSGESAATFTALIIGDKEFLTENFANSVKNAGLSHILVVSGMHMAIICGGVLKLLKRLKLSKAASSVIAAGFVLFFMAICGFTPSVMRAGLTYFIMIFSGLILRKSDAVSSLCAAAVIMTIINPFIFGSVSFLLSVSATAGVLAVYPKLLQKFDFKNKYLSAVWHAVLISLSAVICTAPITFIFFGTVNLTALISSVLVSFAVTCALIIGALAVIISFIAPLSKIAEFPFFITDILIRYFNFIVKFFG